MLADRLETTFGNYYDFHNILSNVAPKGFSLTQIISGLDITEMFTGTMDFNSAFTSDEGDFNLNDSLALQQIFRGDNFFSPIDEIKTDNYSYDLIKFFDGIFMVDPEIMFNSSEIVSIMNYLNLGGKIFLFLENQTEEDILASNSLINSFNLEIANQTQGEVILNLTNIFHNYPLDPSDPSNSSKYLTLNDPLSIRVKNISIPASNIDKVNEYLYNVNFGEGNLIIIGDDLLATNPKRINKNINITPTATMRGHCIFVNDSCSIFWIILPSGKVNVLPKAVAPSIIPFKFFSFNI